MAKKRMKKKPIIIIIIIILLIFGLGVFYFLNNVDEESPKKEDVYVTITFDSDGGSEVPNKKIKEGGTIKLPGSEKDGSTFAGWYNGEEKVSDETVYTKDTTLVAKWEEEKTFKVTFDSDGGSKISAVTVTCDKKLELPEEPTKKGYTFIKWIIKIDKKNKEDEEEKEVSDGQLLPCEDITLMAIWEKEKTNSYTITFDSKGGSKVSSITVECDKTVSLPSAPTRDGYTFMSWADKNGKVILDGALLYCEDVTLYANWEKKEEATPIPSTPIPSTPTPEVTIEPTPEVTPAPVTPEVTTEEQETEN